MYVVGTHWKCLSENWRKLSHNYYQILLLNNSSATCITIKDGFYSKAVEWSVYLFCYISPVFSWLGTKATTLPTLQTRGRSLCNVARETIPFLQGPEIIMVSSHIPPEHHLKHLPGHPRSQKHHDSVHILNAMYVAHLHEKASYSTQFTVKAGFHSKTVEVTYILILLQYLLRFYRCVLEQIFCYWKIYILQWKE